MRSHSLVSPVSPVTVSPVLVKFHALARELNQVIYERGDVIHGLLLALLASEPQAPIPVSLIGAPGTSKTMLLKALCSAVEGDFFSWMLNPSTMPDEILGPIRTKLMVEQDEIARNPKGKLPKGEIVFLDEIFNGNEAVLELLLPILADGEWYNGSGPESLPLKLFVSASNKVPDTNTMNPLLAAVWDRFVLRYVTKRLERPANFRQMLKDAADRRGGEVGSRVEVQTRINTEELEAARAQVRQVDVELVLDTLVALWQRAKSKYTASDRRWTQWIAVIQAEAFLSGRSQASVSDVAVLRHTLWDRPEDAPAAARLVTEFLSPWVVRVKEIQLDAEEQVTAFWQVSARDTQRRHLVGAEVQGKLGLLVREVEELLKESGGRNQELLEVRRQLLYEQGRVKAALA